MTNHPAIIAAGAQDINDELIIIASALDMARRDAPDADALCGILDGSSAAQRIAWTVARLMNYAQRHGARPCAATLERMIEEGRHA